MKSPGIVSGAFVFRVSTGETCLPFRDSMFLRPSTFQRSTGIAVRHSTNWLTLRNPFPIFNHMVELSAPQLDTVFHALGDATRRRMLRELASGERTVGQLAEPFAIS